jgi:hypothetical protein
LPRDPRGIATCVENNAHLRYGSAARFLEKSLRARSLPIEIGQIRVASDPLTATARGALIAAMYEK